MNDYVLTKTYELLTLKKLSMTKSIKKTVPK